MKREFKRTVDGKVVEHTVDGVDQLSTTGLGDMIASLAEPIAKALKLPCIDPSTGKTKPESGCGKMKSRLNAGMPVAEAMKLRLQGK